jgi:hypothetical protein
MEFSTTSASGFGDSKSRIFESLDAAEGTASRPQRELRIDIIDKR